MILNEETSEYVPCEIAEVPPLQVKAGEDRTMVISQNGCCLKSPPGMVEDRDPHDKCLRIHSLQTMHLPSHIRTCIHLIILHIYYIQYICTVYIEGSHSILYV
jgi:hypothetical protein